MASSTRTAAPSIRICRSLASSRRGGHPKLVTMLTRPAQERVRLTDGATAADAAMLLSA